MRLRTVDRSPLTVHRWAGTWLSVVTANSQPRGRRRTPMGKVLVVVGLAITTIGLCVMLDFPFGRLPGDIVIRRGSFSLYIPIATSILLSVLLTLALLLLGRR